MSVFQVKLKLFILIFFSGTRSRTQNTNVIFYPHGIFFILPWMGVSGFVDSKSSNVFGGELNENILKLKKEVDRTNEREIK